MQIYFKAIIVLCAFISSGCSTTSESSYGRSGREAGVSRPMNYRSLTSDSLYEACIRERPERSCRNRLGR